MNVGDTVVAVNVGRAKNNPLVSGQQYEVVAVHPGNYHTPDTMVTVRPVGWEEPTITAYEWRFEVAQ